MKYQYAAKTKDGKQTKKGEIEAYDQRAAIELLREKGFIVYSLVPRTRSHNVSGLRNVFTRISMSDKSKFTDQLASLLSAGLPLTKSFENLAALTENKKFAAILEDILGDVEAGLPLSESFAKFPAIFDESYISLVRAGESSGKLGEVFQRLAETIEKRRQLIGKVKGALVYPAIVLSTLVVVFILIVVIVIPKMSTIYESMNIEMPLPTQIMIGLSQFLTHQWWAFAIILVGGFFGIRFFAHTKQGKYFFGNLAISIPIFGVIIKQSQLVEFARTLSLLIEAGVAFIDALQIVQNSLTNILYRDAVDRFIEDIKHGTPLSQSVAKEKIFPALVASMLVVGEETGTVDQRLRSVSLYFENEVDKSVKNMTTAIEPLVMILLGIMVTLLIISVITPIYSLTSQF